MRKLEDQIRAISTSNMSKEKEMKAKLEANSRTVVEAKQAEMDALEKARGTGIHRNKTLFWSLKVSLIKSANLLCFSLQNHCFIVVILSYRLRLGLRKSKSRRSPKVT